jgi:hypothetical protein
MSAEDFAKKHPGVADLIIERGFRAQSLINQYGNRPKFRLLYGMPEHGHMQSREKKYFSS